MMKTHNQPRLHDDEIILRRVVQHLKTKTKRDKRMQKKLPFWAKEMYNMAR
jgi:hypothetical protein